jgi:hypothetical protein
MKMATTNDAMFEALAGSYPSAGQTLGDLLYTFWSEKGLQYRGSLAEQYLRDNGGSGDSLGDLFNSYFSVTYDAVTFDFHNPDEWLELWVFDRVDTIEQEVFIN